MDHSDSAGLFLTFPQIPYIERQHTELPVALEDVGPCPQNFMLEYSFVRV